MPAGRDPRPDGARSASAGDPRPVIAVDGHGAERGPEVLADGVRQAAAAGVRVRVFGDPAQLSLHGGEGVEVIECLDSIGNEEEPVSTVRARPEASVVRAVADVAAGGSAAVAGHGSTGALMAAATFGLKRMKGVQRPALAARVPVPGKPVLFLDVGANTEVRAQHLVQFAYLGAAFSQAVLGVEEPAVGLLSVGEEPGKGTEEVVAAGARLREAGGIRFIGNVEGGDLMAGGADVVVCGGFVGNVAIKVMEGTVRAVTGAIRERARTVPSITFIATLPTKPPQTTTSAPPAIRSPPSTLPINRIPPASRRRAPAATTSSVPLPGSSPTESRPTAGSSTPRTAWLKAAPR